MVKVELKDEYTNFVNIAVNIAGKESFKLKTDVFNEISKNHVSMLDILMPNCKFMDINNIYCEKMKRAHPDLDVFVGDIRKIDLLDKSLDMVLDLSTLDHVAEYDLALSEYSRVLKNGGILALACWVAMEGSSHHDEQYIHNKSELDEAIFKKFNNIANSRFVCCNGGLWWYLLRNK